jgi:hypothetical protein
MNAAEVLAEFSRRLADAVRPVTPLLAGFQDVPDRVSPAEQPSAPTAQYDCPGRCRQSRTTVSRGRVRRAGKRIIF